VTVVQTVYTSILVVRARLSTGVARTSVARNKVRMVEECILSVQVEFDAE
jgi:hypothetical protein